MGICHDMKKNQVYVCETCGLELKVIKECETCCENEGACGIEECNFVCCGESLALRK